MSMPISQNPNIFYKIQRKPLRAYQIPLNSWTVYIFQGNSHIPGRIFYLALSFSISSVIRPIHPHSTNILELFAMRPLWNKSQSLLWFVQYYSCLTTFEHLLYKPISRRSSASRRLRWMSPWVMERMVARDRCFRSNIPPQHRHTQATGTSHRCRFAGRKYRINTSLDGNR